MNFSNKAVVVTGGTSGVGRELVRQLQQKCSEVIVIAREQTALNQLSESFANVSCYSCNLDKRHDLEQIVNKVLKLHPNISIVINNAGIQNVPKFIDKDFDFDGIELEVKINLISPMWIVSLFLDHLLASKQEAAYVNVTSGLAVYPKTSSAVYCATKAGLRNFSQSLRYQLEKTNISVFDAILPLVDTRMTRGRGKKKLQASEAAKAIINGVEADKDNIYVGIAKLIPVLCRLSPSIIAKILKKG